MGTKPHSMEWQDTNSGKSWYTRVYLAELKFTSDSIYLYRLLKTKVRLKHNVNSSGWTTATTLARNLVSPFRSRRVGSKTAAAAVNIHCRARALSGMQQQHTLMHSITSITTTQPRQSVDREGKVTMKMMAAEWTSMPSFKHYRLRASLQMLTLRILRSTKTRAILHKTPRNS